MWFDRRLRFNLSTFLYDYEDLQTTVPSDVWRMLAAEGEAQLDRREYEEAMTFVLAYSLEGPQ